MNIYEVLVIISGYLPDPTVAIAACGVSSALSLLLFFHPSLD
jgi:hypothetical protein